MRRLVGLLRLCQRVVVAAQVLADVGDVTRFADRNRFASWTGTAPLDASSGERNRHRLSRAGNRGMNHMIHIAAISQIRLDTDGQAYYRRKREEGKKPSRRSGVSSVGSPTPSTASPSPTNSPQSRRKSERAPEGTAGRLNDPARSTYPRSDAGRLGPPRLLWTLLGSTAAGSHHGSRPAGIAILAADGTALDTGLLIDAALQQPG